MEGNTGIFKPLPKQPTAGKTHVNAPPAVDQAFTQMGQLQFRPAAAQCGNVMHNFHGRSVDSSPELPCKAIRAWSGEWPPARAILAKPPAFGKKQLTRASRRPVNCFMWWSRHTVLSFISQSLTRFTFKTKTITMTHSRNVGILLPPRASRPVGLRGNVLRGERNPFLCLGERRTALFKSHLRGLLKAFGSE